MTFYLTAREKFIESLRTISGFVAIVSSVRFFLSGILVTVIFLSLCNSFAIAETSKRKPKVPQGTSNSISSGHISSGVMAGRESETNNPAPSARSESGIRNVRSTKFVRRSPSPVSVESKTARDQLKSKPVSQRSDRAVARTIRRLDAGRAASAKTIAKREVPRTKGSNKKLASITSRQQVLLARPKRQEAAVIRTKAHPSQSAVLATNTQSPPDSKQSLDSAPAPEQQSEQASEQQPEQASEQASQLGGTQVGELKIDRPTESQATKAATAVKLPDSFVSGYVNGLGRTAAGLRTVQLANQAIPNQAIPNRLIGDRTSISLNSEMLKSGSVVLTVDPHLQLQADALLKKHDLPWGAIVALDPRSGRILAMSSYSSSDPTGPDVATRASFPAASLFKLVTAAAAIEQGGMDEQDTIFYRGGDHSHLTGNALPDRQKDRRKISFAEALGKSVNPAFARIAINNLSDNSLEKYARSFGFNQALPFDAPVDISHFSQPEDQFDTARTAAGFGDVTLSPLHAAVLTGAIANRGVMMRPYIIDKIVGEGGSIVFQSRPTVIRNAILGSTADTLLRMMESTVDVGTARRQFVKLKNPFLRSVSIAGKTGTLSGKNPKGIYHWFVAAVPANNPEIVLSALVIDPGTVRVRCSGLAREFLEYYFRNHGQTLQTKRELSKARSSG